MSDDNSSGGYIRKWERLPSALNRIVGAGIAEDVAKRAICDAIADKAIEIQLTLLKHTTRFLTAHDTLCGADVDIPTSLNPEEMDFENSRPKNPWGVKRERIPHLWGYWDINWIEVSRADVTRLLIPAGQGHEATATKGLQERSPRPHQKRQTSRDRACLAITELYPNPNDIPDQAAEPNATLCKRVAAKLKEMRLPHVSDDTILRAAGRRK